MISKSLVAFGELLHIFTINVFCFCFAFSDPIGFCCFQQRTTNNRPEPTRHQEKQQLEQRTQGTRQLSTCGFSKAFHYKTKKKSFILALSSLSVKCLYQSSQAAITKCHMLGGLNSRHLFLTVLEAGKSKIKVLADWIPGESPLCGLQTDCFLFVLSHGKEICLSFCFYKGPKPIKRVPHSQ